MTVKLLFFQFLFEKMSKYITIKYYTESEFAKESYGLFAAETKTFLPKSVGTLTLDLRWAMPTGFYGKLFPRSGILKEHFVSIDAGVIDSDFRGIIQVLILNHHPEKLLLFPLRIELLRLFSWKNLMPTSVGCLINICLEKLNVETMVLDIVIVIVNSEEDLQMVPEKSENDSQITSEEAIMTVNNEVVVRESITIDE